jgi:hypothetical protein
VLNPQPHDGSPPAVRLHGTIFKGTHAMHYLVILRCMSDDVPLYLSNDEAEARGVAGNLLAEGLANLGEREAKLLSIDLGDKCNLSLFTFDGGRLVKHECLHDFS